MDVQYTSILIFVFAKNKKAKLQTSINIDHSLAEHFQPPSKDRSDPFVVLYLFPNGDEMSESRF